MCLSVALLLLFIYLSIYMSAFQHLFLLSLAPLSQTQGSSREGWLATEEKNSEGVLSAKHGMLPKTSSKQAETGVEIY